MTYERPGALLRDFDAAVRAAEHELGKTRNTLSEILEAAERGKHANLPIRLAAVIKRLDSVQSKLQIPALTQHRQRVAEPREAKRQQSTGPPDDLVCKKCGQGRDRNDFFWDDGHGGSGYTMRCVFCRRGS